MVRRVPVRLLAFGALCSVFLVWYLIVPRSHDSDWWKHVGISGEKSLQLSVAPTTVTSLASLVIVPQNPRRNEEVVFNLSEAFVADYDMTLIRPLTAEELAIGSSTGKKFEYLNATALHSVPFVWVSERPRIAFFPGFISHADCDEIVSLAQPIMFRSQVAVRLGEPNQPVNEVRTSSQAWLDTTSNNAVGRLAQKLKTVLQIGEVEMLQVLRYDVAQKYDSHHDFFDPKFYGRQMSNRCATTFIYFNDVEDGGETVFPNANNKDLTTDYHTCARGLRVRPRKGNVVVFYDMLPDGTLDQHSLHGGCPVKKGVKFGGTLWFRVPT